MSDLSQSQVIMAFDVGLKRTGVAVGRRHITQQNAVQHNPQRAQPAGQILVNRGRHDQGSINRLIDAWQPHQIVLGSGSQNDPALTKAINRLRHFLEAELKLKVVIADETLTSAAANTEINQQSLTTDKKIRLRDQVAACLILESWLADQAR